MSENTSPKYRLDLIYTPEDAQPAEMAALRDELTHRGHTVNLKPWTNSARFVDEISKSARDFAQSVGDAASTASKTIREVLAPVMPKSADAQKDKEAPKDAGATFDTIGPAAATSSSASSNENNYAIVTTTHAALAEIPFDVYRIGLLPHTELKYPWSPSQLNAIAVPHKAIRAYLESVGWASDRVFDGGWLTTATAPSDTRENLRKKFGLTGDGGPIILVLANNFDQTDLQTIMLQFSLIRMPYQVFFYYGESTMTADALRQLAARFGVNARMFGAARPLADYFGIADLAVAPAADKALSVVETAGIPVAFITEKSTSALSNFLCHENAATSVQHAYELANALTLWLSQPDQQEALRKSAADIAGSASVKAAADAIEAALAARSTLKQNTPETTAALAGFETIGQAPVANPNVLQPTMTAPAAPAFAQPIGTAPFAAPAAPAPVPAAAPVLTPTLSDRTYKDIHKEYTQLLLLEKSLDRSLDAAGAEVTKWEERLDLARQNHNDKLVNDALIRLKAAQANEMAIFQQKDSITQQKNQLRQHAHVVEKATPSIAAGYNAPFIDDEFSKPEDDALENEFKAMQQQQRLQDLRSKMGLK